MTRLGTLKPLLLAVVAIAIAGRAQSMLLGQSQAAGWLLFAAAVILFLAALGRLRVGTFAASGADSATAPPMPWSHFRSVCLGMATLAAIAGVVLFRRDATTPLAWDLHLVGLVALVAALLPWDSLMGVGRRDLRRLPRQMLQAAPILLILALAIFARFWQLRSFPFGSWADEASNALTAMRINTDPAYRPIYIDDTKMPAEFNYLIALCFSIFGTDPGSLRIVTAVFGIASIPFAFLLFRRWLGTWMGVFAAAVVAVMRYHLTFSRFGVQAIPTPTFELAALYFLDRGLARRQLADFGWLGLSIGLGLVFYTGFRLFPAALLVFLLFLLVGMAVRLGIRPAIDHYIVTLWQHWFVALLALLIALAPVAEYAATDPQQFFSRTSTVSIFQQRDEPNLGKAVLSNTLKHLEMFNFQGDRNGRHNLPGAPMLDPVMGVLFVLGVGFALRHWREPHNGLMLLVFAIMLLAGILSLDFEAPQSLRSIGVIPALIYFITLPIAVVGRAIRPVLQRPSPPPLSRMSARLWKLRAPLAGTGLALLIAVLAYINFHTFFVVQQNDPSAWAAYSTAETITASEMRKYQADDDFLVTAVFDRFPTIMFLAGDVQNKQRWTASDRLPLVRTELGRGLIMLLDGTMLPAYLEAKQVYPDAQFVEWRAPAGGGTVLYEVIVPAAQLQNMQGVEVSYFPGTAAGGAPSLRDVLTQASVDWNEAQPISLPFVAQLRATLRIQEHGDYRFTVDGSPGASLWVDDNPVAGSPISLASGNHSLRLEVPGSATSMQLLWQPPGASQMQPIPAGNLFKPAMAPRGLVGSYYPDADWSGVPALVQIDPAIAFYFHITPLPQPFSVEWNGKLFAPTEGEYDLALQSVDGSWLDVDQLPVVENPTGHTKVDGTIHLTEGWHDIRVRFVDQTGGTQIYLSWTPPGATAAEWIPSRYLSPPMAQLPSQP